MEAITERVEALRYHDSKIVVVEFGFTDSGPYMSIDGCHLTTSDAEASDTLYSTQGKSLRASWNELFEKEFVFEACVSIQWEDNYDVKLFKSYGNAAAYAKQLKKDNKWGEAAGETCYVRAVMLES